MKTIFFTLSLVAATTASFANSTATVYSPDEKFTREANAGDFVDSWIATLNQGSSNQRTRYTLIIETQNNPIEVTGVYKLERSPDYQIEGRMVRGNLLVAFKREGSKDIRHIVDPRKVIAIYEE